jgi:hypothetical protein
MTTGNRYPIVFPDLGIEFLNVDTAIRMGWIARNCVIMDNFLEEGVVCWGGVAFFDLVGLERL